MNKKTIWPGVTFLLVVTLVLSSCGPTGVTPTEVTPTEVISTEVTPTETGPLVPRPEGTVVYAVPHLAEEGFLTWIGSANSTLWEIPYEYLIYLKTDGTPVGGLAERWETADDATSVTLWLREGIPWHDGWGEVTAEDVKYTFERDMEEASTNTRASALRDKVESIEEVDPYTVVFHLKNADPTFWFFFTDVASATTPILCKKYVEQVGDIEANENPIGSGPYRLVEHAFGDYFKFEALSEHWRVVPEFQYLVVKIVPEASTRVAMLKTGEVDVAEILSSNVSEVEEAGFGVFYLPGADTFSMVLGGLIDPQDDRYVEGYHQQDPWVDIRVREAMNIAIDREAIIEAVFNGAAVPITIKMPLPGWKDLEPYPYDPQRARDLLADAGYADGFSFKLMSFAEEADIPVLVEAVAGYWENIGLTPTIVQTDWATYKANNLITAQDAGEIFPHGTSTKPEYTASASLNFKINGGQPNFQSQELDSLFMRLAGELDWDKRMEIWNEMATYLHDNYADVAIAYASLVWAFGDKVEKMSPVPGGQNTNIIYLRHAEPLNTFRLFELEAP